MLLTATALWVVLLAGPGDAQEPGPVTFGVSPSTASGPDGRSAFEYELDPGAVIEDYVGVSNLSDSPLELAVYASDAFTTSEGGFDLLPASDPPVDVGAWVGFAQDTFLVPARSRLDVPFRLTVPANATPGDHPGGIVASLRTPGEGGQVSVDRRVGARIYLRVTGDLAPALQVSDVTVAYDGEISPLSTGAATVTYTVANTGNVRLAGPARLRVAGPFGVGSRTVELDDLPEILPGGRLTRTETVDGVLPLLRLRGTVTVEPLPVDGAALDTVSGSAATWALPVPQLASLIVVGGLLALMRRRRRARERRHAAQLAEARAGAAAAPPTSAPEPAPESTSASSSTSSSTSSTLEGADP